MGASAEAAILGRRISSRQSWWMVDFFFARLDQLVSFISGWAVGSWQRAVDRQLHFWLSLRHDPHAHLASQPSSLGSAFDARAHFACDIRLAFTPVHPISDDSTDISSCFACCFARVFRIPNPISRWRHFVRACKGSHFRAFTALFRWRVLPASSLDRPGKFSRAHVPCPPLRCLSAHHHSPSISASFASLRDSGSPPAQALACVSITR